MRLAEPIFAMGSNFGDLDNDGFLDFYIGTGAPSFTALVPNKMYRNNNAKTFQDVTTSGRFGHIQKGHAVSFGDFDNDGDQDIFHVLGGAYEGDVFTDAFFENPIGNKKELDHFGTRRNNSKQRCYQCKNQNYNKTKKRKTTNLLSYPFNWWKFWFF